VNSPIDQSGGKVRFAASVVWLSGGIKTVLIFEKACRRNLDRIALLGGGRLFWTHRPEHGSEADDE
jgi:hypothetical protein